MAKRVLITGAGGFIGAHVLEHVLTTTTWDVVATDSFRHKGKTDRIREVLESHNKQLVAAISEPGPSWRDRTTVVTHDLTVPFSRQMQAAIGPVDYVFALASESHVDRSIEEPVPFVRNNVDVCLSTLEYCRVAQPAHVVLISTDEVYGPEPLVDGCLVPHREWAPILPSNPYSASKAAQEAIAISYWRTYGLPLTIVNCMNLIGERQDSEKYLPKLIKLIDEGREVEVHGQPGKIGSRHYLHARNLADALVFIARSLPPRQFPDVDRPERYNVVGPDRVSNLELAVQVSGLVGRQLRYRLVDFHSARPGHDPHYGLDPAKLTAAGWTPPVPFGQSLARTVQWALTHPEWLE